ncbi:AMP-binding protein [Paenarthrobacter sp. Z7-10]|uniref:AMP-binding protein n=1 Tax=Paenarthrobacter sp. Z7-10 TaxID=2787635 RepID=UPI0022A8E8E1|nr:AMP-binding protein [Paenarthrobacter sp. Z7-10]MCZ2404770.1 AMP-binding protein [Paenarthrobacter sp. Z7-10]
MLSYTAGEADVPLLDETIGENFERIVERFGDREALVEASLDGNAAAARRWTFQQLNDDVDRITRGLLAAGVAAGDRVGVWSPNCAEWTILQYATAKVGAVLVNVNPAYRTHELIFVVRQNGMRMLVLAPSDRNSDYVAMGREAAAECPDLTELIFLPVPAGSGISEFTAGEPSSREETTWEALDSRAEEVPASALSERAASLRQGDAINIQYTSGTTGFPKGATLTHRNILNNGFSIGRLLGYTEYDRVVIPVPFYHCFGMVIGNINAFSHGCATILPARGFNPSATLKAVQDFGGTSLYGVPTMFIAELALADFESYQLDTLRTGVMAGSLCPNEVMKRVITDMHMDDVAICYGMTETSPVSTMTRAGDSITRRTETVGRTMPHLEGKIIDAAGLTVERGEVGELCTKGYAVMAGYWDQPDKTAEAIDSEGWMHTGDLAGMDNDGYIIIEGRIKDMIIRGGENVYPREVEEFLYQHPSVQDVQVIGVPDKKYGEELMACIILKPGTEPLDATAVTEFCRGRLAHYKIPRYVEIRESFPMTVSGKVRKIDMREEAIDRLGLHG